MKKIAILYIKYYDFTSRKVTVGGIQTYISDLIDLCVSINIAVDVYQMGDSEKCEQLGSFSINQIQTKSNECQKFTDTVYSRIGNDYVLVIYATDHMVPKYNPFINTIAIQHGISWDMPRCKCRPKIFMHLLKAYRNYNIFKKILNVDTLICVDYNFINWLRAQSDRVDIRLEVIPNYTRIAPIISKPKEKINIIFARRFFWYRGTRVFTEAVQRILDEGYKVDITVAGSGPDEGWMRERLEKYSNVKFIQYQSDESLEIHKDRHIAIVPTVGSEGTSLSLLEAMSSQCAVICTNVGGMTNIVIDGFNGLMVNSGDVDELYEAIKKLIENSQLRDTIRECGYQTVQRAFSYEKWKQSWIDVLSKHI